jgi:hypothetical protein
MTMEQAEQRAPDDKSEESLDDAVGDSFAASGPPSTGGVTRIGPSDEAANGNAEDSDVPEPDPDEATLMKKRPRSLPPVTSRRTRVHRSEIWHSQSWYGKHTAAPAQVTHGAVVAR